MAERPVFIPLTDNTELVKAISVPLIWHPGFSLSQKRKNIAALHESAMQTGVVPLLEVSTKSEQKLGQRLSAFNLKVNSQHGVMPLEMAFQGSKIFAGGGPFTDLYKITDPSEAKRDPRLRESGPLIGFRFEGIDFPLEPKTAFYDWLYINTLYEYREWLRSHMLKYSGFTDIEFNPERSINCQARSCALLVSLIKNNLLNEEIRTPEKFVSFLSSRNYDPQCSQRLKQQCIFQSQLSPSTERKRRRLQAVIASN